MQHFISKRLAREKKEQQERSFIFIFRGNISFCPVRTFTLLRFIQWLNLSQEPVASNQPLQVIVALIYSQGTLTAPFPYKYKPKIHFFMSGVEYKMAIADTVKNIYLLNKAVRKKDGSQFWKQSISADKSNDQTFGKAKPNEDHK